ncbi:MAG: Unknown protein [uncultured Sulfurovum sp.]|uniref:Uncharacterized protein n=1 Tax=uncultured Sulfurovum sp. TaxID=269237 RepID=A0A6S6TTG7_9BACT|nr:MAG: Unknown protein [uncultured Sulfurovum sp.]
MDDKKVEFTLDTIEQVADMVWLLNEIEMIDVVEKVDTIESIDNGIKVDKNPKDTLKKKRKDLRKETEIAEKEEASSVYENAVSKTKTDIKADPIRMPKKLSLSNYRAWEKSFKSFYFKVDSKQEFMLDETKTVELIAKTRLIQPIVKAKKIKYFRLVMVIEQSPSMDIWNELILEFQKTIQRFGVFEGIDFYYLSSNKKGVHLYADRALTRELDYKKLSLRDQTLLTIVSDCVSSAWHSNHIFRMLELWSRSIPVSITQMFPKRMWHGTSLYKGFHTSFTSHAFKQLNKHLRSDDGYYDEDDITFNLPVINFEPESVNSWSSVIYGKRDKWIDGVILDDLQALPLVDMSKNKKDVSVEDRVNRYLSQASPLAQKLALYASVLPVSFHVVRVLQELKLPESSQVHLAEFFLGGLIKREVDENKKVSFDFHDGVREHFRNQLTATTAYKLQESMSHFVSENLNSSVDFQALIDNPNSTSGLYLSKDEVAFVKLRAETLRKLGGEYGKRADGLMQSVVKGVSIHIGLNYIDKKHYGEDGGLKTSVSDALFMKEIATSQNFESSKVLLNESATREAVVQSIELVSKKLSTGDFLFISFSGYSGNMPNQDNEGKKWMWFLYDGFFTDKELNKLWALFDEGIRIFLLSDGYLSSPKVPMPTKSKSHLSEKVIDSDMSAIDEEQEKINATVKILTASKADETSYILPNQKYSLFIEVLKEVWNNGLFDGTIDMFFELIKEKMQKITHENKLFQEPTLTTFGGENKIFDRQQPFSIKGAEGVKGKLDSSIVVISSTKKVKTAFGLGYKNNESFRTGFIIANDNSGCYVLTVLDDAEEIKINNFDAKVVGSYDNILLLYIKNVTGEPLELETNHALNRKVYIKTYQRYLNMHRLVTKVAELTEDKLLSIDKKMQKYKYWKVVTENYMMNDENRGAPLISDSNDKVIGILNSTEGTSEAYAISIEILEEIIPKDKESIFQGFNTLKNEENNMAIFEVIQGTTTLLIYMAADNNLASFAENDLETIKRASENSDMQIVVQFDRNEYVDQANTIRMSIKNGEVLKEDYLGETNTGDPKVLKSFIEESVEAYPSDKLIVILWSHGSGVDDADVYDKGRIRERYFVPPEEIEEIALGFDDTAQDFLDNLELQKALDISVKIDVLGFDACLMGMFEILYQLREQTSVMVASQHLEPASGWDYHRILNELDTSSTASVMGRQFVAFHDEHHTNERRDVTQSALNTMDLEQVTKKLDSFAKVLREELKKADRTQSKKDLYYTLKNSQFFNRTDYVDLVDFVIKVKNRLAFEALEEEANSLLDVLEKLILANHTIGYYMEDANGVSIYFPYENRPFADTFDMYEKLDFAKACPNWLKLLKWYWL